MHLISQMPCRFSLVKRGTLSSRLDFEATNSGQRVYEIVEALTVGENFKKSVGKFAPVENAVEPQTQRF